MRYRERIFKHAEQDKKSVVTYRLIAGSAMAASVLFFAFIMILPNKALLSARLLSKVPSYLIPRYIAPVDNDKTAPDTISKTPADDVLKPETSHKTDDYLVLSTEGVLTDNQEVSPDALKAQGDETSTLPVAAHEQDSDTAEVSEDELLLLAESIGDFENDADALIPQAQQQESQPFETVAVNAARVTYAEISFSGEDVDDSGQEDEDISHMDNISPAFASDLSAPDAGSKKIALASKNEPSASLLQYDDNGQEEVQKADSVSQYITGADTSKLQKQAQAAKKNISEYKAKDKPMPFTIQVASFRTAKRAMKMESLLKDKGYDAYLQLAKVNGQNWFRVKVGQFPSKQDARQSIERIAAVSKTRPYTVKYE